MTSRYEGGLGTREGGDLVRWSLEIDSGMSDVRVVGASSRALALAQTGPAVATLTLHTISREESVAVIALLNEMRSASQGVVITQPPSIGSRFAGLEFD